MRSNSQHSQPNINYTASVSIWHRTDTRKHSRSINHTLLRSHRASSSVVVNCAAASPLSNYQQYNPLRRTTERRGVAASAGTPPPPTVKTAATAAHGRMSVAIAAAAYRMSASRCRRCRHRRKSSNLNPRYRRTQRIDIADTPHRNAAAVSVRLDGRRRCVFVSPL